MTQHANNQSSPFFRRLKSFAHFQPDESCYLPDKGLEKELQQQLTTLPKDRRVSQRQHPTD